MIEHFYYETTKDECGKLIFLTRCAFRTGLLVGECKDCDQLLHIAEEYVECAVRPKPFYREMPFKNSSPY